MHKVIVMLVQTILNSLEKFKSFVYEKCIYEVRGNRKALVVDLKARKNSRGKCIVCGKPCSTYDTRPARYYEYVPLWNIPVYFRYPPRRVNCKKDGIHIERVPWACGKERMTKRYPLHNSGQPNYEPPFLRK